MEDSRKESLPEDVVEAYQLEVRGQVRIDAVLAEMLVVFDVIPLKTKRIKTSLSVIGLHE